MPYAINDGIRIHYEVEGDGPPLILGHGSALDGASWRDFGYVDLLSGDYRLILVDARGHGQSDRPRDPGAYGLTQSAADFVAVLDHLDIPAAHYFGYSMGGWMGLGCAKYAPERFGSFVIGASHPYFRSIKPIRDGLSKGMAPWVAGAERGFGGGLPLEVKSRMLENDIEVLIAAHGDRPDFSEVLPTMTMPCLFYAGEEDPLYPDVRRASEEAPGAQFFSLPGEDHFTAFVRTDLVVPRIKEFLGQVAAEESR